MSDEPDDTSDEMRGRVQGSRLKVWLLMEASRRAVVAVLLLIVFAVLVVLGVLDPVGIRTSMRDGYPIETAFQAYVTAIITGVTLVVTINQLVLSQELGAVGDQQERMRGAMEFRRDVEEVLDRPVAPAEPAAFLEAVVDSTRRRAEALADVAADTTDGERRERITTFVDELAENARSVTDRLEDAEFGTFDVVSAALNYNYSAKLNEARQIRADFDDESETGAALDRVIEALEFYGPTREHVKTLYFQWELINLSRAVLYAALPALIVVTSMIFYVNMDTLRGATLGVDNLVWTASAAVTVALVPFVVLLAYILRIATVAKRTLAIGPFVLRETDRGD